MDHPVLRNLGEATNDLVTWSNVRKEDFIPSFRSLNPNNMLIFFFFFHFLFFETTGHLFIQRRAIQGRYT